MPFLNGRAISNKFFTDGLKGPRGNPGLQGSKGDTGLQGVTGLRGTTGTQGATGFAGLGTTGLPGLTGFQGLTGAQGIGLTGLQGLTGFMGITGSQGLGATGLQGIQGVTGLSGGGSGSGVTGSQGVTGIEGSNGSEGPQGVTGLKGLDGLDGPPGDPGQVGLVTLTSQVSVTSTNSETTIISYNLPPGSLEVGSQFKFIFYGTHQNHATSGTLTFRMYIGSTASQTILLASTGTARAQSYMEFYGLATVRTLGSSGTYIGTGIYQIHTSATATTKAYQGGASTTVVNTLAPYVTVRITAQWQTSSATNSLLIQNAVIEKVK